jgi:hypothetical protein
VEAANHRCNSGPVAASAKNGAPTDEASAAITHSAGSAGPAPVGVKP